MDSKKAINLVALIITIIVLIILTATVIITFKENGIIDKARQAVFKSDISTFREELTQYILKEQAETFNNFDKESLTKTSYNEIKEVIKSFKEQYDNQTPLKVYYQLENPAYESIALPKIPDNALEIKVLSDYNISPSKIEIEYYSETN